VRVLVLDGGDKTHYLSRLVVRLAELGVEMHYAGSPRDKDFAALERAGVRCHEVLVRHKLDLACRWKVRRLLDRLAIDLLHTITGRDAYVGLKARAGRPLRVLVRRGAYPKLSRFDPVDRLVYGPRGADRLLVVSDDLKRHMVERGVAPERIATVYTGIWSEHLAPVRRDLRSGFGVPAERALLGLVGNLRRVKGFDLLLDALPEVRTPFHLLVAGRDYEGQRREIERRGLGGRVTLVGYVADVMTFLPNVELLVMPSRIDAAPRAAIEATVVGTPILATSVGGIPEILDFGRGGTLVEPTPEGLAAGIDAALADRAHLRRMADHALTRNRELFGLERCARLHLDLYSDRP